MRITWIQKHLIDLENDRHTDLHVELTRYMLEFFKLNRGEIITDPGKLAFT